MRPHVPFEGTTTNRDTFKGWQLPPKFPGIGLEIQGDQMYTLLPSGCNLPFIGKHVFSTANDNQREICILIYSGNSKTASQNELLGQFDMTGLPASRARTLQIEVRSCTPRSSALVSGCDS
jgi:molecular chaperone DnaK (HSP70)